jgi:hypothetical protein
MFRIKKYPINNQTLLLKIEGEIRDDHLNLWTSEMRQLRRMGTTHIILDFCWVSFISPKAVHALQEWIFGGVYVWNSNALVRNMLQTAGLSGHILDRS